MSRFGRQVEEVFTDNIFSDFLEPIVDWITDHLAPEDVFSEDQLEEWAEENGFKRIY